MASFNISNTNILRIPIVNGSYPYWNKNVIR